MPYRYRLWCPDCYATDQYGCFSGGIELSEEIFNTIEDAKEAAFRRIEDTIWEFDVVEVDDAGNITKQYKEGWLIPFKTPNDPKDDYNNIWCLQPKKGETE